ncbi:MAG: RDD family protein [Candidatus Woesearchaeota archaeon]
MRTFTGPASIIKRFAAFFVDLIILEFFAFSSLERVVRNLLPQAGFAEMATYLEQNPDKLTLLVGVAIIAGIYAVLYFTLFEWSIGQTPGKMLVKIRIKEDKKVGFLKIFASNITFLPVFPFNILWIVDPLHMFFSQKNQRFMEKLFGIEVVEDYSY